VGLARGPADVDAVAADPPHDREAAGALVATAGAAAIAQEGEAHAAGGHGTRQLRRRDELAARAV
jgi:hypothetical protein